MQPAPGPLPVNNWFPVVDPVCRRQVAPIPIAYHVAHGADDYYFCSLQCAERFRNNPSRYLEGPGSVHPATTQGR